ncbi:FUSC family protein [Bradyrhizobium sp. CB1650]|uniref:FUSC family protein n=1 Tax=Bradyrhizobium sp. CB1650 TaxID=3039153 RepID=UPI0024352C51|nr:FUSC family protein [Bradyrhizobium sp. CB1650]WGD50103.1 FUSC family protein [Bradyrhizobium sp. CB1650]
MRKGLIELSLPNLRGLASDLNAAGGWKAALVNAARTAGPPLLFGLRLWVSVCLALYVAFWLQLDDASWAGTSAALVCQPLLGASLRKGWFRMIGTLVGAAAIVALTACFPQDSAGFLVGLALWGGACALVATLLRNFASYAAALAGFTAAIIASDELGAIGGTNGQAFTIAITRVSEIWIGIVCAGVVLAGTGFGAAPRRLAALLATLSAEIASKFDAALTLAGLALSDMQPVRRELVRQVIALDPVIDEAIGESSRLHSHSRVLQAAIDGLFEALAGWSAVVRRLARLPDDAARQQADAVLDRVPRELRSALSLGDTTPWVSDPTTIRRLCDTAVRSLTASPAATPSLQLLVEQTARVLAGLSDVLDGLALLVADRPRPRRRRRTRLHVPDWLPAVLSAGRAFVTIGAVEVFWIATAWPDGALAITWTAISVLLSPRADATYVQAANFMVGTGLAAVCAAIVAFAGLPNVETFAGFSIVMGLFLIPAGALMAQPWQASMFAALAGNFVLLLAPANQMSYDTVQFYNAALAIVLGCGAAALSFRLLPPLSPAKQSERLLALTLRDLRRLAIATVQRPRDDWEGLMYSRLAALPNRAEPVQRAQLLAALSVGAEIVRLRRIAPQLGLVSVLDSALEALAQGNSLAATARLTALDQRLALLGQGDEETSPVQRERARVLSICDALVRHHSYFDVGASV